MIVGQNEMRLYHPLLFLLLAGFFAACSPPQLEQAEITISLTADGQTKTIEAPAGSTVQQAFELADIPINNLDIAEPPLFTVLTNGSSARLIRVVEEFETVEDPILFDHQTVQSESLPEGERLLSQVGVNGVQERTVRYETRDGQPQEPQDYNTVIRATPVPEIIVVGIKQNFAPQPIPGKLAYLLGGNAWVMEGDTGTRRPVIVSGDLDGRIFSLSPDGAWLLYTRRSTEEGTINTLWAARIEAADPLEVDLGVANVVHSAEWSPDSTAIAYSTVEPRETAPGWQANNDLWVLTITPDGDLFPAREQIEANAGGLYGWWGVSFAWAPGGERLAYARPDSVGLFTLEGDDLQSMFELIPYQTGGDWAWAPGFSWGPDGKTIYTVEHGAAQVAGAAEESPDFNLIALPISGSPVKLASQVGMFATPVASPLQSLSTGEKAYQVAYLQAVFPAQSVDSPYRLWVIDRDGSDRRGLFPPEGQTGLKPQRVVWQPLTESGAAPGLRIAVVYNGNIWLVDPASGTAQQITGDGITVRVDWK